MYVIGTAGHVDHGKSTLVQALTGIDPDRLKEEKVRQMTIDLGFAWFTLPNDTPRGELIGVVDVPGHRDFIENMLAGVGSINAVLFVVAADEGIMPQTREHLAIIDLLNIPAGIIVLTKTDLVPDPEWLDLVQLDVLEAVRNTVLENAPLVPVSARTGKGLDDLKAALTVQLAQTPSPLNRGKPRLWVDRVFSVSGFGTVVTGTLLDGTLQPGQDIELQPGGLQGRIRGMQTHNQSVEMAYPGSRVAVNISGIERDQVRRGMLLTLPDTVKPSSRITAYIRLLPDISRALKHNTQVKLFCGSAETMGRVRLLDSDSIEPGTAGWVQLELANPLPVIKGDRFILRYPSPAETIGGGQVVQVGSMPRYKRNQPSVIAGLSALTRTDPHDLVLHTLNNARFPLSLTHLVEATGLEITLIQSILSDLQLVNQAFLLGNSWLGASSFERLLTQLSDVLTTFHTAEPLSMGIRVEKLRHQMNLDSSVLDSLIEFALARQIVQHTPANTIARYGYVPQTTKAQRATIDRLMAAFAASPFSPPSIKESENIVGSKVLSALIEWGDLIKVSDEVLLTPQTLAEFATQTQELIQAEGSVTIKALRDRFSTSRKYAQAVLEYFDRLGITRRDNETHILASGNWDVLNLFKIN